MDSENVAKSLEHTRIMMKREESVRKKIKVLGWGYPVVILVIFIIFISMFASAVQNIDKDKFFSRLEMSSVYIWPRIAEELRDVGTNLLPHYSAEVDRALGQAIPELEPMIEKEMETFSDTIDGEISAVLIKALSDSKKAQEGFLLAEIPELQGDKEKTEKMLKITQGATVHWIKDKINKALQDHAMAFIDMKNVLDKKYRRKEKESIDPEKMLSLWLELMGEKLHGTEDAVIIEPEEAKKGKRARAGQ